MRKYIITLLALMQVGMVLQSFAQIGVNTDNPQQLFHIDAQRNTSGTTNISDDVVIDSNGNMGIGTISPTAKLHIATNTVALRLQDGTQGSKKMLYSKDTNGSLSWTDQPASSATIYYLNTGARNLPNSTRSLLLSIPVTEAGNYLIFIRWWGSATTTYSVYKHISAYLFLTSASTTAASDYGAELDGVEHYVSYPVANAYFCFTTSLFGNVTAGGYLKLWIIPSVPTTTTYNWVIGAVNTGTIYNPSIIVFKI